MEFETSTVTLGLFEQAASVGVSETVSVLSDLLNSQPITARQAAEKAAIPGAKRSRVQSGAQLPSQSPQFPIIVQGILTSGQPLDSGR